jgi:chromosome segregation ATPase
VTVPQPQYDAAAALSSVLESFGPSSSTASNSAASWKIQLELKETEIAFLKRQVDAMFHKISALHAEKQELLEASMSLQHQLEKRQQELGAASSSLNEASSRDAATVQKIASLEAELREKSEQVEALKFALSEEKEEVAAVRAELLAMSGKHEELMKQLISAQQQLVLAAEKERSLQRKYEILQEQASSLRSASAGRKEGIPAREAVTSQSNQGQRWRGTNTSNISAVTALNSSSASSFDEDLAALRKAIDDAKTHSLSFRADAPTAVSYVGQAQAQVLPRAREGRPSGVAQDLNISSISYVPSSPTRGPKRAGGEAGAARSSPRMMDSSLEMTPPQSPRRG